MNTIPSKTNSPFPWPRRIAVTGLAGFFLPLALAAKPPAPAIVPLPVKMEVHAGVFTLTPETVIIADAASTATARQLAEILKSAT
jgi:hypothetical protein